MVETQTALERELELIETHQNEVIFLYLQIKQKVIFFFKNAHGLNSVNNFVY